LLKQHNAKALDDLFGVALYPCMQPLRKDDMIAV